MSIDPLFDVDRRVVVVTGGMGQLGRRFSQALRQRGARVVVLDVAMDDATVAQRYGHDHDGFLFVKGDVTSGTSLQTALVTIENAWGVPHALINNAAIDAPPDAPPQENGPFETYPEASWDRVMAVNAKGVFLCAQTFGAAMARAGRGSIVNIASIGGMMNGPLHAYGPAKAGVIMMTGNLAGEWGRSGVRVNSVSPGHTLTPFIRDKIEAGARDPFPLEDFTALGRMVDPAEVASTVLFLVSDMASAITGVNLAVDCGASVTGGWRPYGWVPAARERT
jgi:NAD(P)-dependent dehydrogenase (short-subunit alcohol dehydrogenase family)